MPEVYSKMDVSRLALEYNSKAMNYGLKLRKDNRDCRLFYAMSIQPDLYTCIR